MKFIWDETKRANNIRKHGIDFHDAIQVFDGITKTFEDTRMDYAEQRYVTTGFMSTRIIVVVHVFVENDVIRIIFARKANKYEQKQFFH